jgi:hypothetical protein
MIRQSATAIAFAALLSGCGLSPQSPVQTKFYTDCTDHSAAAKDVDWSKPETIKISFEDRMFSTGLIQMEQGKPYILRIENPENFPHWFRAEGFFRDTYISKVTYNGKEMQGKCLESVQLAGLSKSEVHLVPVEVDNYEFQDTPFIVPVLGEALWNSDTGFIFVR